MGKKKKFFMFSMTNGREKPQLSHFITTLFAYKELVIIVCCA